MTTTIEQVAARLDRGDRRFDSIESDLADVKGTVAPIPDMQASICAMQTDMTAMRELLELVAAAKGVGKFAVMFGRFMKWVGMVAGGVAATLAAFKFIKWW